MAEVPEHHQALVDEVRTLFAAGPLPPGWQYCNTFWRSHGCDLPEGHALPHLCICDLTRQSWDVPAPPSGVDISYDDDELYDVFGTPLHD